MSSISPIPQRASLAQKTAECLREALRGGLWLKHLPGERELSRQLSVSRPTLRAALEQLRGEGVLKSSTGRPHAIVRQPSGKAPGRVRVIGLLTPLPLQEVPPFSLCWMDKLRETLAASGDRLEIHSGRRWYSRRPEKDLAALVRQRPAAAWVLFVTNERMQRWFAEAGLPCVLAGSCHEGIELPSLDVDYRAVCAHAVSQFVAGGHRRIALMLHGRTSAGDRESEIGAREMLRLKLDLDPLIAEHDGTPEGVKRCLAELLRQRPAPTAFLVARSMPLLTVASELMQRGLRLAKDVAVIGRDSDHYLDFFSPALARYRSDPDLHARGLARVVTQLARGVVRPAAHIRIMPEFFPGESLRR